MSIGAEKDKKPEVIGQIRASQLITTFGSGSIVDMPDYSVIMSSIDKWKPYSPRLKEFNLQRLLGVSSFKAPFVSEDSNFPKPDVPAYRFPKMHICSTCGYIKPYTFFSNEDSVKKCPTCNHYIVPSRFITACINGHIDEFPYDWWVHRGKKCEKCDDNQKPEMKIEFSDKSSGLDSIVIECALCGKKRTMEGCMSKDALAGYHCRGKRPWMGSFNTDDPKDCSARVRCLQRGASNVYFGQTQSALTIPPWGTRIQNALDDKWDEYIELAGENGINDPRTAAQVMYKKTILNQGCTLDQLLTEIERRMAVNLKDEYTPQMLREDEYRMLIAPDQDEEDFKTEHAPVPDILNGYVSDIILLKKLREVVALKGFRRIYPGSPGDDTEDDRWEGWNQDGDVVPLSDQPLGWLPAVEMKGEGVFIHLNLDKLDSWNQTHEAYYRDMGARLQKSKMVRCENFSPQYVLLHTLSHLLIRQLSIECGYSGASIKERIYSTYPDSTQKMAGILLYTSASDTDGSLGGLVRNGLPDAMEKLFRNLLQEASWCSSDPVCFSSHAQGMDSLNYAACHACALLPETCCEMRNCLLDRTAVIGKFEDRTFGFFGDMEEVANGSHDA